MVLKVEMNRMTLCKSCGKDANFHHRFPFCPKCEKKMTSFSGLDKVTENHSRLHTYYVCKQHGIQEPVMKDLCPRCGAEIETEDLE